MKRGNLFGGIPSELAREQFDELHAAGKVRIERILSRGQTSPESGWYEQAQDEWVALLAGEARIAFEDGEEVSLGRGDWVLIGAGRKHRVTFTSSEPACVWLAVHL